MIHEHEVRFQRLVEKLSGRVSVDAAGFTFFSDFRECSGQFVFWYHPALEKTVRCRCL